MFKVDAWRTPLICLGIICLLMFKSAALKAENKEKLTILFIPTLVIQVDADGSTQFKSGFYGQSYEDHRKFLKRHLLHQKIEFEVIRLDPSQVDAKLEKELAEADRVKTSAIMADLIKQYNADGALGFWQENHTGGKRKVSANFYLPGRIQLIGKLRGSFNVERRTFENDQTSFTKQAEKVLRQQLTRITKPLAVGHTPEIADGGTEEPARQDTNGGVPTPPFHVSVLEFSEDWIQNGSEVRKKYPHLQKSKVLKKELKKRVESEWADLLVSRNPVIAVGHPPLTYDEVAAPAFAIDADPRALEKKLTALSEKDRADLLIFGHLQQTRNQAGKLDMNLILRVFVNASQQIYSSPQKLRPNDGEARILKKIDVALAAIRKDLPPPPPAEYENYKIKPRDGLMGIARKCYGDHTFSNELAVYNDILNEDKIKRGQTIKLPITLNGTPIRKTCRKK